MRWVMVTCLPREYGEPTPKSARLEGRAAVDRVKGEFPFAGSARVARFPEVRPEERVLSRGKFPFDDCKVAKFCGDKFAADKSPEEATGEERPDDKTPKFDPEDKFGVKEDRSAEERLDEGRLEGAMFESEVDE